jgi:hypothetical protein
MVLLLELKDVFMRGTELEVKLSTAVVKKFMLKLMKASMNKPEKLSIELDDATLLALNFALGNVTPEYEYNQILIWEIHAKIHRAVSNIS